MVIYGFVITRNNVVSPKDREDFIVVVPKIRPSGGVLVKRDDEKHIAPELDIMYQVKKILLQPGIRVSQWFVMRIMIKIWNDERKTGQTVGPGRYNKLIKAGDVIAADVLVFLHILEAK